MINVNETAKDSKMTRPTTLISLSGGQDSTFVLWQHLSTSKEPLLVHHVRLRHNTEDRLRQEAKACVDILRWLSDNGYKNFEYHESTFDYGTLPRISVKDIQIIALFQGIILRTPRWSSINTIKLCWHKGEVDSVEVNRGYRVKAMFEGLNIHKPLRFEFPIKDLTRAQMAAMMPPELLRLVHCCRKPRIDRPQCGKCKTCKELKEANIIL